MKNSQEYQPLTGTGEASDADSEISFYDEKIRKPSLFRRAKIHILYIFALLLVSGFVIWQHVQFSLLLEGHKALKTQFDKNRVHLHHGKSPYASLMFDTQEVINPHTKFMEVEDEDAMYRSWKEFNLDSGVVALSDDYADNHGIPRGMRFPWDDSMGVYVLNTFHVLHCVKSVEKSLHEYRLGMQQSNTLKHVYHCLDTIRRETMCYADDVPWSTGDALIPEGQMKQARTCRNFEELSQWGRNRSACFSYDSADDPSTSREEHFKFCPEGSPYAAAAAKA